MIITLIILLCFPAGILGNEVCYDQLDCFSDQKPWSGTRQRLKIPLPWTPHIINTRFFLLTRGNSNKHQEIDARDMKSVKASTFQTTRRTCFIVHGMGDRAENNWVPRLCREILQVEDVNCIGVDWHYGSGNVFIYAQATSNVQVVGAEIAYVLRTWQKELEYSPRNVHIIGHSLGAQVAGEAGKRHPGIRRITGLDPARLHFENTPNEVSLDASDANFVDVIHTDTDPLLGLGLIKPTGHFDFYPNGGRYMPGCPNRLSFLNNMNDIVETIACNHLQAFRYFIESVRSPGGFISYPCPNYESFKDGSCFPCATDGCPSMGYFSEPARRITGQAQTFYLNTGADPDNFSSYRYKVTVTILGSREVSGQIFISLFGDDIATEEHQVVKGTFTPGNSYSGFIDSDIKLDEINCVDFLWTPVPLKSNVMRSQMGAGRIDLQSGEDGGITSFCTSGRVKDKVAQTLGPCGDFLYKQLGQRTKYEDFQ
ncbi:pancreatic lipase-related protein 2-like isoform X2 [Rhinoderma darwinii]|uniref:pancreatic lipase-related protein 2-like isoform X2 n=1 Tax=Rhinoderma darwinii TaxID=43563 RepID=UPI003F67792B